MKLKIDGRNITTTVKELIKELKEIYRDQLL